MNTTSAIEKRLKKLEEQKDEKDNRPTVIFRISTYGNPYPDIIICDPPERRQKYIDELMEESGYRKWLDSDEYKKAKKWRSI